MKRLSDAQDAIDNHTIHQLYDNGVSENFAVIPDYWIPAEHSRVCRNGENVLVLCVCVFLLHVSKCQMQMMQISGNIKSRFGMPEPYPVECMRFSARQRTFK